MDHGPEYQLAAIRVDLTQRTRRFGESALPLQLGETAEAGSPNATGADSPTARHHKWSRAEQRINAVKRSTISTGQLKPLLALHTRPIDLVVYEESSSLRTGDLFLKKVSRLYAFSVYPDRT
jgi:hypothetical protein